MTTHATRVRPYLLAAALIALIVAFAPAAPPAAAHSSVAPDGLEVVSGTVTAIVIEDRVNKTAFDYRELNLDDGTAIPLHGKAAESLSDGTRVRVTGRRVGTPLEVASVEVLAMPPTSGQAGEPEIAAEGTLAIAHSDDFATGKSRYIYQVHEDAGKVTTLTVGSLPSVLRGGSRVIVSGKRSADAASLRPSRITILGAPATGGMEIKSDAVVLAATNNPVLLIMANFNNTTAPSLTQTQAQGVMTTNSNSVSKYYDEVSYGQQLLNVTTTPGWVTMNLAKPSDCSDSTVLVNISNAADAAATAAGFNPGNYGFVVYLFPSWSPGGCGWSGLAYVNYPHKAYINGTGSFVTSVVAHEMGHNFGLWHAGSLNCGSASIGGSCSVSEYGDPWDVMGNQRAMHFNAMQKSRLGWIPGSSVQTHTSGSASYTLSPIETGGATTYAVKVPTTSSSRTYWIEYRQPLGFDAPLASYPNNGAQIRVSSPLEWTSGADDTEIVDMTPATSGNFTDSALLVGQSYLDSTYGVNIIVLGATASALTVSVTKAGGAASTTALASSSNPSSVGTSVTFTATVTGTSPTGSVNFKDGASSITGCSAVALAGSGNVRTAACTTSALTGGAHSLVATYSGDAANASSSSAALSQTVNKVASTTGIGTSLTPSTAGGSVTFTATVSGSAPTGSVNFKDGANSISGCSAVALGGSGNIRTATCATAGLTAGSHSMSAVYGGDTSNNASTSSTLTQTVNKVTSSTALSSSANPSGLGASVTFTASVTGFSPTGSINFTDGGVSISGCSAVALSGSGNTRTAQCSTSGLGAATHSIVASYGGDASNVASISATLSQVVKAATNTLLSSSVNPSAFGASVSFTATVSGTAPTGSVNFKDGANSISGCAAVALSGSGNTRTAQCSTSGLSAATHSIVANYGGDAGNAPSISATLTQVVNGTVTSVNAALASAGAVASASSTSSSAYPAAAINNGDRAGLNFGAGGVWKDATGSAFPDWVQIDFSSTQTIDRVIVYSVQDNNLSPVDPSDTLTFTQRGLTAFDVQAWNGTGWVTLGAVTGNNLVKRTVSFAATTTNRVRVVINSAVGGKSIYSFVTEVEAWTPGGAPPAPTVSATLASSLNPAKVSQSVTFTATVAGSNPSGTVAFTRGGSSIAGCAAVALTGSGNLKSALCTTSFAATGTYAIAAGYGGDANNAATSSAPLSEVVKASK